jgi:hypothetical protein
MLVRSHFDHRASSKAGISNLPLTEMERFFELPRLYQIPQDSHQGGCYRLIVNPCTYHADIISNLIMVLSPKHMAMIQRGSYRYQLMVDSLANLYTPFKAVIPFRGTSQDFHCYKVSTIYSFNISINLLMTFPANPLRPTFSDLLLPIETSSVAGKTTHFLANPPASALSAANPKCSLSPV